MCWPNDKENVFTAPTPELKEGRHDHTEKVDTNIKQTANWKNDGVYWLIRIMIKGQIAY